MTWHVWRLQQHDSARLAQVRHLPGLEVCESEDAVWLRVEEPSDAVQTKLAVLPATQSSVQADGQLIERGKRVPRGHLPKTDWQPLTQWIQLSLPTAGFGGQAPEPISLSMTRDDSEVEANLLLATFQDWHDFATSAAQVRLNRLTFAVDAAQQTVVRGTPLPPLKGRRFVLRGAIAVEAGWTWLPEVSPQILAEVMQLQAGEVALLLADGSWNVLGQDHFVQATRAAVQATAESLTHGN
ncbi:hypothetical protein [Blastopirellula marina]|uniref:MoxR-vWA-beta-propeller ternary system domain-containing protein n=1 Tax=Blastopirellula marina TaxID=124 RepID=A0A2S8FN56_9BACT|nr:hypothetical protein [Blastopirellula marina]PQO33628.1 hypothetical protein C5Y98_15415 [Blastopirellula marina]PTL43415.1 hypothetical protein C5Y97_15425 [Blastopirellula marina]